MDDPTNPDGEGVSPLRVEYCGEVHDVLPGTSFVIGRLGDLQVDDNPHLHRRLILLEARSGIWWLANVGDRISVTVVEPRSRTSAYVMPGSALPLVFGSSVVTFAAGPTAYELSIEVLDPPYEPVGFELPVDGTQTVGPYRLNDEQLLLLVALAEPKLRSSDPSRAAVPSNKEVAVRLGWTLTKFNRKLDHLCSRLADLEGVKGLRAGEGELATDRRQKLVDHALHARIVTAEHLSLLAPGRFAEPG
jgi:hypothetical protein